MTSRKTIVIVNRSERQTKSSALTARDRRRWFTRLTETQEAIEKDIEAQDKVLVEAYNAGLSYAAIAGPLGVHSTSIRDRIIRVTEGDQGGGEGSQ